MTKEESIFLDSGLLEAYALDMCTAVETAEVNRMLDASELVRKEFEEIQEGIEVLAKSRAVTPPSGIKERILAQIANDKVIPISETLNTKKQDSVFWKIAAGLALLLALGFLFKQTSDNRLLQAEIDRLKEVQSQQQSEAESLRKAYDKMQLDYAFTSDPQTERIILQDDKKFADLQLVAYWNEQKERAILDVTAMPEAPEGKCFQLWADVRGEMISVAVISQSEGLLQIGDFHADAESLNITVEDLPGSDHATVASLVTSAEV